MYSNTLCTDPMDYFLLDSVSGELRTARPLDKEAVENAEGILTLNIKVGGKKCVLSFFIWSAAASTRPHAESVFSSDSRSENVVFKHNL